MNARDRLKALVPAALKTTAPKAPPRRATRNYSLWRGPDVDGITFSLLSRFLVCRERFRLKVVHGYTEEEGFNKAIEYGSMWHEMEEGFARTANLQVAEEHLNKYVKRLNLKYQGSEAEILKWSKLCRMQFPLYVERWKNDIEQTSRQPVLEEVSFKVPYTLPSGRSLFLRGKFDAVFVSQYDPSQQIPLVNRGGADGVLPMVAAKPAAKKRGKLPLGVFLQENKSKGDIDQEGILGTVAFNLQTMLYHSALLTSYRPATENHPPYLEIPYQAGEDEGIEVYNLPYNCPLAGCLYNVVRRPLSDRYSIKQKKGRVDKKTGKRIGAESLEQFNKRAIQMVRDDPANYFMRWRVLLTDDDVAHFKERMFHAVLEQLMDWWESIKADPFNPWYTDGVWNKLHWQAPWGVYNSMYNGFRGDFYDFLAHDRDAGLHYTDTLFPELV